MEELLCHRDADGGRDAANIWVASMAMTVTARQMGDSEERNPTAADPEGRSLGIFFDRKPVNQRGRKQVCYDGNHHTQQLIDRWMGHKDPVAGDHHITKIMEKNTIMTLGTKESTRK